MNKPEFNRTRLVSAIAEVLHYKTKFKLYCGTEVEGDGQKIVRNLIAGSSYKLMSSEEDNRVELQDDDLDSDKVYHWTIEPALDDIDDIRITVSDSDGNCLAFYESPDHSGLSALNLLFDELRDEVNQNADLDVDIVTVKAADDMLDNLVDAEVENKGDENEIVNCEDLLTTEELQEIEEN